MASPPPSHAGGAAATRNTQYIQQFLSNVLSQRGPSALPYAEDVKWLIRQHLLALVENYPSLQPKTATFTHNDGRTVNILQAEGTIPIVYAGVVYNIPVVIWLMESYPRHSSCVYVTPTRDMIIKRPHSHVNPSGLVSHPYLQNWIYPSSNLVDLVGNLCHVFSREPPLYSRPHRPNPNPRQSENSNSNSSSSSSSSIGRAGIPPKGYSSSSSPYGNQFPPSPQRHRPPTQTTTEDPSEVYRRNAINKLMEKLHVDSEALGKGREAEMEGLFNLQTALRQREEHLSKELRKFQGETEELEQQLQMVLMNTDLLESWLRENEGRVSEAKILEVEEILEPCDALSKQMLECTASDLAIEDVVYSLDKAVQEGSIPFDQYLRSIRSLSREQFFHRAMASKIKSTQLQAQVSSMAARASQYM